VAVRGVAQVVDVAHGLFIGPGGVDSLLPFRLPHELVE
jgi:hypothetical protein